MGVVPSVVGVGVAVAAVGAGDSDVDVVGVVVVVMVSWPRQRAETEQGHEEDEKVGHGFDLSIAVNLITTSFAREYSSGPVGYLFNSAVRVRSDGLQIVAGEAGPDGEAEELRDRVGDGCGAVGVALRLAARQAEVFGRADD